MDSAPPCSINDEPWLVVVQSDRGGSETLVLFGSCGDALTFMMWRARLTIGLRLLVRDCSLMRDVVVPSRVTSESRRTVSLSSLARKSTTTSSRMSSLRDAT